LQSYNAECRNRCSVNWSADYKRKKYNSGARPGLTENSLLKSNLRWHCGFLDCHCGRGDSGLASGLQPWLACIQIECHQNRELRCSVARRASARRERGVHGVDVSTRECRDTYSDPRAPTPGGRSKMGQSTASLISARRMVGRMCGTKHSQGRRWPGMLAVLHGSRRRKLRKSQAGAREGTPGNKSHALLFGEHRI
jgi:hypothetical protein